MEASLLALAQPDIGISEWRNIHQAFQSGYLTHRGEWEAKFEMLFHKRFGRKALATSSGTAALHIALLSCGIGHGDEVILPVLTFGGAAAVVRQVGAKPVFVDVKDDYCMNWELALKAHTRKTKAIIPTHLYGERCEFWATGVKVIEDSCEALGYVDPSTADFTAYSFYGNKVITTGEGGMLLGNADRRYRDGGFTQDYDMEVAGLNYRMTNMQAAIGCAQFSRLSELLSKRNKVVETYKKYINGIGKWLFVIQVEDPKDLSKYLSKHGIEARPVFKPLHLTQAFKCEGSYPVSERLWKHGLCLPVGTHIKESDAIMIAKLVRDYGLVEYKS